MADIINTPDEGNASEVTAPTPEDRPEALRGKSDRELVDMYRSLESKLGEQSQELGQLRKLADQALMQPGSAGVDTSADEEIDFFTDPMAAVEKIATKIVQRETQPFHAATRAQSEQATINRLNNEFPNWKETAASPDFEQWVAKSKVRMKLYSDANQANYEAAQELFQTWDDLGKGRQSTAAAEKKAVDRDRKLRAVATEKGSAGIDPRKILSRSDLRNLKQTNPNRYNDLLPDIRKAYAEGRVR